MRRRVAVQAEHADAATRQVKRRRAPHRAEAGDNHVVAGFSAHRECRIPSGAAQVDARAC
jgi:hypothetical protein